MFYLLNVTFKKTPMINIKNIVLTLVMILTLSQGIEAQKRLKNGTKVPNIEGIDNHNQKVNLYKMLDESPVVVVFYRGEWCKYCNLYMRDLADSLSMITDLGAKIIAVTPESNLYIDETVNKTKAHFSIVYDEGHTIMDNYDVTWHVSKFAHLFYKLRGINLNKASHNNDRALPVPATYIIGQDRKIIDGYFNKDFTIRMPVSDIVIALKSIKH